MALGSIQPLTEMSTKGVTLGGGRGRPVLRADNLITFMFRLSRNYKHLNLLEPLRPVQTCSGLDLPLHNLDIMLLQVLMNC